MTSEDYGIIYQASKGDVQAFSELVRRHSGLVYRVALRIVGPDDAQDVSQEAWIRVWRALDGFRQESAFSTWLYRITVNSALSERQRRHRRFRFEQGEEDILPYLQEPPGGEGDPESATLGRDRMDETIRSLRLIRADHRAALVLRHLEGLSYPEIAEVLEIPEGTAKGWVSRARAALLVILSRERDSADADPADAEPDGGPDQGGES